MAYEHILYEVADHVATITLNRPAKLNAWTAQMEREVEQAAEAAGKDDNVRVIVLTGAGRGFCAGADLANLDGLAQAENAVDTLRQVMGERYGQGKNRPGVRPDFSKTYSYFPSIPKPVIGALNGPTAGLGLVVSLYCDVRIASDQAKFSTAFARRGLIAEHGISWMLRQIVGLPNALDLLLSARMIDAAEALRMGLVNRVVPHEQFADEVRKYALELAQASSPRSMAVMKREVYNALFQTLAEAIDSANEDMIESIGSEDFKEGVAHFLQKRPPAFTGR